MQMKLPSNLGWQSTGFSGQGKSRHKHSLSLSLLMDDASFMIGQEIDRDMKRMPIYSRLCKASLHLFPFSTLISLLGFAISMPITVVSSLSLFSDANPSSNRWQQSHRLRRGCCSINQWEAPLLCIALWSLLEFCIFLESNRRECGTTQSFPLSLPRSAAASVPEENIDYC